MKYFTGIFHFSKQLINKNKEDKIGTYAAHTSFFTFISLFPFMIILMTCIKYTPLTEEMLYELINTVTPNLINDTLKSWIEEIYSDKTGVLSVSILVALWAVSKSFMGIIKSLNEIYDTKYSDNYFLVRIIGMGYALIFLFSVDDQYFIFASVAYHNHIGYFTRIFSAHCSNLDMSSAMP